MIQGIHIPGDCYSHFLFCQKEKNGSRHCRACRLLIHPPKGDAFAERNVYAMRIDYEKEPPMFRITDTHYAATWLLDERAPKVKVPM